MKNPEQSLKIARSLLENKLEYLSLRKEFITDFSWYFTFTLICITLFCIYALTNLSSVMGFLTGIGEGINSSIIPENLKPVTFTLLLTTMGGFISGIAFTIKIFLFSGKIDKIKKMKNSLVAINLVINRIEEDEKYRIQQWENLHKNAANS
jgi:hypothetical protein